MLPVLAFRSLLHASGWFLNSSSTSCPFGAGDSTYFSLSFLQTVTPSASLGRDPRCALPAAHPYVQDKIFPAPHAALPIYRETWRGAQGANLISISVSAVLTKNLQRKENKQQVMRIQQRDEQSYGCDMGTERVCEEGRAPGPTAAPSQLSPAVRYLSPGAGAPGATAGQRSAQSLPAPLKDGVTRGRAPLPRPGPARLHTARKIIVRNGGAPRPGPAARPPRGSALPPPPAGGRRGAGPGRTGPTCGRGGRRGRGRHDAARAGGVRAAILPCLWQRRAAM